MEKPAGPDPATTKEAGSVKAKRTGEGVRSITRP